MGALNHLSKYMPCESLFSGSCRKGEDDSDLRTRFWCSELSVQWPGAFWSHLVLATGCQGQHGTEGAEQSKCQCHKPQSYLSVFSLIRYLYIFASIWLISRALDARVGISLQVPPLLFWDSRFGEVLV